MAVAVGVVVALILSLLITHGMFVWLNRALIDD
jgi:hypothetical protein